MCWEQPGPLALSHAILKGWVQAVFCLISLVLIGSVRYCSSFRHRMGGNEPRGVMEGRAVSTPVLQGEEKHSCIVWGTRLLFGSFCVQ